MAESNKNYDSEGFRVVILSDDEKKMLDQFLMIKAAIHAEWRTEDPETKEKLPNMSWYILAPMHKESMEVEQTILQNWYRDLSRRLKLSKNIHFHSTAYRKKLQTMWSSKLTDASEIEAVHRHLGHGFNTAWRCYKFNNKASNAQVVSNLVDQEFVVSFTLYY